MTDRDDLDLGKLRALEHTAPPRRRLRSPWWLPVIVALELAIAAFVVIGPTQVPPQLVGVFSDRPVSELTMKGGSWVEIELTRPDPGGRQTAAIAETFRTRGADVAFSGAGKLILEIPGLREREARDWAETISSSGTFEVALVERMEAAEGPEPPGRWVPGGSHRYLLGEVALDADSITRSTVGINPVTSMAEVLVDLSPEAARRFASLTRDNVGSKLAIVFGGEVISAPQIASAIESGRTSITTGAASPEAARAEAEAIARILVGDPLSAEVEVGHVESVDSIAGSGAVWAGRGLFAALLGLIGFAIAAPFRRRLGAPDPDVAPLRGVDASRRPVMGAIAVTCLAVIAAMVARVPLPGFDLASWQLEGQPASWAAIGVLPFLIGAVVARAATLAFPRLSRWGRWAGFAAGLGFLAMSLWLWNRVDVTELYPPPVGLERGHVILALLALGGTSLALYGLAILVDRFGVGSGFAAVLAGLFVPAAAWNLWSFGDGSGEGAAVYLAGVVAIAVATVVLLRTRVRGRDGGRIPLIGAGIAPLVMVSLISSLVIDHLGSSPVVGSLLVLGTGAVLVAAVLRPRSGSGPRVVSEQPGPGLAASAGVAVASFGYLGGLMLLDASVEGDRSVALLSGAGVAIAVAAALDVIADVRARWRNPELVRVAAVADRRAGDSIAAALASAGIDCHVRNRQLRWVTGAAGAWVPLEIWAPAHRAAEVAAIVDGQL